MMENIGYALLGTPDGLQMRTRGVLENRKIGGFVDLQHRVINLVDSKDEILAVIREYNEDNLTTYFVLYRYALEIDRNRTGAFHGSVVALKNSKAPGSIIYMMLIELAAQVAAYTQPQTGKFLANLDSIPFREPYHLAFLESSISSIEHNVTAEKDRACFVFAPRSKFSRSAFLDATLTDEHLLQYEKCFFSESPEVDKYVREQGGLAYFTEQKSTEEHLLSFGTGGNVDFQLNLTPTPLLLDELKALKHENNELRATKQQLEKQAAELARKGQPTKEKASQEPKQNQGGVGKPPETTNPANVTADENNQKTSNPTAPSKGTNTVIDTYRTQPQISSSRRSIMRVLSIRGFVRLISALFAIFLISLIVLLALGKYVPYLSDLLPAPENQDTLRRPPASRTSPEALSPEQAMESIKARELSEEQETLWADIEAYLNEIEPNLNYDGRKMKGYKTRMEQAEMQDTPQYQRFVNVYNNYMGSGLPHEMLVEKSIIPEGRLQDISIDIISEQAPLTAGKLAVYIAEKCPSIPVDFAPSAIERTIINANPSDVNQQTGVVKNIKGRIAFYIPKSATCNLN